MRRPLTPRVTKAVVILTVLAGVAVGHAALAQSAAALLEQSEEARRAGDLKKAIALADEAVAAEPRNARCYAARAALHDAARDYEKLVADCDKLVELAPDDSRGYHRRGSAHFRAGHIEESVRDFDKFLEMEPAEEPYHWQRGISLYYAGRYEDGRKQFEAHQAVNKSDVENAAWHYLCVARVAGVEKARAALIPISGDTRVPLMEIYAMFAGKGTPEQVLATARAGDPSPERLKEQIFYAHLYIGLFHEAAGEADKAREHIDLATGEYLQHHYMGDVARVHAARLRSGDKPAAGKPEPSTDEAPVHGAPAKPSAGDSPGNG